MHNSKGPDKQIPQKSLSIPYEAPLAANPPLTPEFTRRGGLLRLDPMFEPLRKDPCFHKLVAASAPK